MDEAKRRENDARYDWWSAEGEHKLIGIGLGFRSRRDIAMANQWHEFFLWRPIAEKEHVRQKGTYGDSRAYNWPNHSFKSVFFKEICSPYCGWGRGLDQISDKLINSQSVTGYTILYERAVDSPYLKELGAIQDECEALVAEMGHYLFEIEQANEKLAALLPFGKAEARQKKAEAERKIPPLHQQIDDYLKRVRELRAMILGG